MSLVGLFLREPSMASGLLCSRLAKLSSNSRFAGGRYSVAIFAGCIRAQGQVAVVEGAAFSSAVFGDTVVFSGIFLLPTICGSNANPAAFSRPYGPGGSACCSPAGHNSGRILSCPHSCACDGILNALRCPAVQHTNNLLPRSNLGIVSAAAWRKPDYLAQLFCAMLLDNYRRRPAGTLLGRPCRQKMDIAEYGLYGRAFHRDTAAGDKILSGVCRFWR